MNTCQTCGAWQVNRSEPQKGECRKESATTHGWPKTKATDWCCVWIVDARPAKPADKKRGHDLNRLGINYVFVRDYSELAAMWLTAVLTATETIPAELRPVLERPLDNVQTAKMPDWLDGDGVCCENLLRWAEGIEGFSNGGDNDEYVGMLMMDDDPSMAVASQEALASLPPDHPWRTHTGKVSAPCRQQNNQSPAAQPAA